jgi:predicted P-loop ATPase
LELERSGLLEFNSPSTRFERVKFMYDNSTPNNGQVSSTRGNLAPSSKSNPCPVCSRTKDGDCRISHDGKMVLCHQNFEHSKTQQPDLWHFNGSTSDGRCGIYIFKEESESIQPVAKKPRTKKKQLLPVPIPIGAKLLRLPAPGQSPQPEQLAKDAPKRVPREAVQITYDYSDNQKVVRYEWPDATNPKGHSKTYSQFHIDPDGNKVWNKGDARWPAYRIDEVVELLNTLPDGEPIIIPTLEGEPKVELVRGIGIAALTLQGSNWNDPETQKMLEALRATGKNVSIAVIRDNDDTGIKKGKGVGLVGRHIQFPCIVIDPRTLWSDIPEKGDIREILEAIGPDEFLKRLESEIASQAVAMAAIEEKKNPQQEPPLNKSSDSEGSVPLPENNALRSDDKLIQDYNKISAFFGNRIRLNKLTKRIEINGQPVSISRAKIQLATKYGILARSGREDLQDILMELAEQNEYSPIEEYLLSLPQPEDTAILDNLAERYFGTDLEIHQCFVRKTLISAVARALSPGCKVDTALILQGNQGFQKSAFFKVLAGGIYFDDSLGAVSDKDERLKLHRAWFIEWAELETVFSRKDVSATKAFLSCSVDALRPPYHRDIEDFPRASIICGSTNKNEFLSDETGNRRFLVVPVQKKIDVALLTQERGAIWAAAVAAYKSGERWWLTPEEDAFLAQANQTWQTTDSWEVAILKHLQDKPTCTISDLLTKVIGLELSKQSKGEQMRVSSILRRNGWIRVQKQIDNTRQWVWQKVMQEVMHPSNSLYTAASEESGKKVMQEVMHPFTALPVRVSGKNASPASPFSTKFLKKQEKSLSSEPAADITNSILENCGNVKENSDAGDAFRFETSKILSLQGFEAASPPALPPVSPASPPASPLPPTQLNLDELELVEMIRTVVTESNIDVASQTAADILPTLKKVCDDLAADRTKVWAALTKHEADTFKALTERVAKNNPVQIAPEDAQAMRNIALNFWSKYYPEHIQGLITQMYGWQAPGTRYDVAILAEWLQGEDDLIRDRLTELIRLRKG